MKRATSKPFASRRAAVLLIVLVIIVLLALAAYTLVEMCVAENEATNRFGRSAQARAFAESGIDMAVTILSDPTERLQPEFVMNRPDALQAVVVKQSDVPRGRGRFSVIAGDTSDPTAKNVRYGLTDESGKLNLNALALWQQNSALNINDTTARNFLLNLPYMTNDLADAILDFIDPDDTARQYGVESDYYSTLSPPIAPPTDRCRASTICCWSKGSLQLCSTAKISTATALWTRGRTSTATGTSTAAGQPILRSIVPSGTSSRTALRESTSIRRTCRGSTTSWPACSA